MFDQADLAARTLELADFIAAARKAYDLGAPVAVGFSNGANIAASLLLSRPDALAGAVLLRAMLPFEPQALPALSGKPVLLLSGSDDRMIPAASAKRLKEVLQAAGTDLAYRTLPTGHNLTQGDLTIAAQWLKDFSLGHSK
jgi:phospholipase/carboxylesterase